LNNWKRCVRFLYHEVRYLVYRRCTRCNKKHLWSRTDRLASWCIVILPLQYWLAYCAYLIFLKTRNLLKRRHSFNFVTGYEIIKKNVTIGGENFLKISWKKKAIQERKKNVAKIKLWGWQVNLKFVWNSAPSFFFIHLFDVCSFLYTNIFSKMKKYI